MKELVNIENSEVVEKVYIKNLINCIDKILNLQIVETQKTENKKIENVKTEIIKNEAEIEDPFSTAVADWENEKEEEKQKVYGFGMDADELPPFDSLGDEFEFTIDKEVYSEEEIFFPG